MLKLEWQMRNAAICTEGEWPGIGIGVGVSDAILLVLHSKRSRG